MILKNIPYALKAFVLVGLTSANSLASSFQDVEVRCSVKLCELSFGITEKNAKLPSYFQKFDAQQNELTIGFADTELPVRDGFSAQISPEGPFAQVSAGSKMTSKNQKLSLLTFKLGKGIHGKSESIQKNKQDRVVFSWNLPTTVKSVQWKVNRSQPPVMEASQKEVKSSQAEPSKTKSPSVKKEQNKDTLEQFLQEVDQTAEVKPSEVFYLKASTRDIVITSKFAFVYANKTNTAKVLDTLGFGEQLKRIRVVDDWFEVTFGNGKAYIEKDKAKYREELSEQQKTQLKDLAIKLAKEKKERKETTDKLAENLKDWKNPQKLTYSSFGRRDPFIPLKNAEVDGVSIDEIRLVGIIWDQSNPIVILEDVRAEGVSYTLGVNDPIINGKVFSISPREVVFQVTEFGVTRKFSMPLPDINEKQKD